MINISIFMILNILESILQHLFQVINFIFIKKLSFAMTECHPDVCPHMHFNKCYAERIRSIPNTIFPDPTIDSFTNVNVKIGNPFKSNIATVAYENFNFFHEQSNDERNFVKDYYMQNYQQSKMVLNNNIVNQLKEDMATRNAYVLADGATKDYDNFQNNRKRSLNMARNRAKSVYSAHVQNLKQEKQTKYQQNGYWLKKLFRKLEEVSKHIIQGSGGQDAGQKQTQFLASKSNLTAKFLSQIKIRNPKNAHDILEELRILMQKKKLQFADERQQQQLNQSVSMSYTSEVSQNTSQGSMISEATSLNQSNMFGQDQIVNKFWDFDQLKNKWNLHDIEDVRKMIRRVLTKQIVFDAELQAVKNRKQAAKIDNQILQKLGKPSLEEQSKIAKSKAKKKNEARNIQKIVNSKLSNEPKSSLNKEEQLAKKSIIQGGRFDAIGQKLQRNKAYSDIFKKKESQIRTQYVHIIPSQSVSKQGKTMLSTGFDTRTK